MRHPLDNFQIAYGLSHDQLAKAFKKSSATIFRWKKGDGSPTQGDIYELSKRYSLSQAMDLVHQYMKFYKETRKNEQFR